MGEGIRPALASVFWTSRLSGVFPLDDALNFSPIWAVPSFCLVLLVSVSSVYFQRDIQWLDMLPRVVFAGISWSLSLTTISLVVLSFPQRKLYRKIIQDISKLEERLSSLRIKLKYSVQSILADIGVRTIFLFASNTFYNRLDGKVEHFWSKVISFYFTQWCISCVEMHIVALFTYLADLFKSLSDTVPSREIERWLEEATALADIAKSFNALFGKQSFLISSAVFLCTTLDLFFYMIALRDRSSSGVFSQPSVQFRCLARFYEIWRLASSAHALTRQSKLLDANLYTRALEDATNQIAENEKVKLYFSMKQEVKFIACGFFAVDFTLIFSILAAVTNYLVILAQFGAEKTIITSTTPLPSNINIHQEVPG